jgi:hypothetical protein
MQKLRCLAVCLLIAGSALVRAYAGTPVEPVEDNVKPLPAGAVEMRSELGSRIVPMAAKRVWGLPPPQNEQPQDWRQQGRNWWGHLVDPLSLVGPFAKYLTCAKWLADVMKPGLEEQITSQVLRGHACVNMSRCEGLLELCRATIPLPQDNRVRRVQTTEYPLEDTVTIAVQPEKTA